MGQLIKLVNLDKLEIMKTGTTDSVNITSVSGTYYTLKAYYESKPTTLSEFLAGTTGTTYTSAGDGFLFPYASSNDSIPHSQTSIPNQVGNCSIAYTRTSTGWAANITITGSADATVKSLVFSRKLYCLVNSYNEALLFAYILDSPITLNADNNYTANLTMSVSFE